MSFVFPLHFRLRSNFVQQFGNGREESGAANVHGHMMRTKGPSKRTDEERGRPTKSEDRQRVLTMDIGGR